METATAHTTLTYDTFLIERCE